MDSVFGLLLLGLAAVAALPYDPVIRKLDSGLRYQYIRGPDGTPHLVDLWGKTSDLIEASRYSPDRQNAYHLFTRQNPTVSQPLLLGSESHLATTNYNANRRTVVLLHGWLESATVDFNTVLVPAFLAAEDVNVIVVDWSAGAGNLNYFIAVQNTRPSGESIARFLTWLNTASGASLSNYHLVGYSLSGQQVGIIGRNLGGNVAYITSLDPPFPGWTINDDRFRSTDGVYTELIHTSAGFMGYMMPLADVDFYPNKGLHMPGCSSQHCSHERSFYYLAESLTSGGFTGRRCPNYMTAISATCQMSETLRMGGLVPKTGQSGVYQVFTNAAPPFSMG